MGLALKTGQCCLLGTYRKANEDAVAVQRLVGATMCVVADGMGGADLGAIASRIATEGIANYLRCRLSPNASEEEVKRIICSAIAQAHQGIVAVVANNPSRWRGSSTVVLGLWRPPGFLYVANVGDSHCDHVRDGRTERLTMQHDIRTALIAAGTITRQQAGVWRNVLYRFLGMTEPWQDADVRVIPCRLGDRFLFSTDGLSNHLRQEEIPQRLEQALDVQQCAAALGQLALDRGCAIMSRALSRK